MRASELKPGNTFGVAFDHGDDFMTSLAAFCREHGVRQGYIPMFLAGFAEADIVGTCEKLDGPQAPVWSKVHVSNAEALGCGTIARDDADGILPHIHTSVGLKEHSATAHTSHLLAASVQFLTELTIVEVDAPEITRPCDHDLYDVPPLPSVFRSPTNRPLQFTGRFVIVPGHCRPVQLLRFSRLRLQYR